MIAKTINAATSVSFKPYVNAILIINTLLGTAKKYIK
jgi:hypothetical protein